MSLVRVINGKAGTVRYVEVPPNGVLPIGPDEEVVTRVEDSLDRRESAKDVGTRVLAIVGHGPDIELTIRKFEQGGDRLGHVHVDVDRRINKYTTTGVARVSASDLETALWRALVEITE